MSRATVTVEIDTSVAIEEVVKKIEQLSGF